MAGGASGSYPANMDAGTSKTYQDIMINYGDYLFGNQPYNSQNTGVAVVQTSSNVTCLADVEGSSKFTGLANVETSSTVPDDSYGVSYSQGDAFSYTKMLLGVEMSAEGAYYNDFMHGPTGDEKRMFMITDRYSHGYDNMEEDAEPSDRQQQNSMETVDTMEEDASTLHFDSKNAENSDGEWDDPAPHEYNIFGDEQANPTTYQQPCDEQPLNAPAVDNNAENEEPIELLSQEDIEDFLDQDNEETYSQEVRRRHTPHIDMIFDSDEQAYHFYNEYAAICGFSIKKAGNYHAKKAGNAGHTRATFLCNRSGKVLDQESLEKKKKLRQEKKQEKTGIVVAEAHKRRRTNTVEITGCLAKLVVSLRNGKWIIISLDLEHNHELSPPDESKFLRSHKHMTDQEKLFIRTFNSVKLPPRKIMAILAYLRGGVGTLPYTKKYISNVRTAIRNECKQNDMTQVLEYFRKRKQADPRFSMISNLVREIRC